MKWSRSIAVVALLAATPAAAQVYPAEPYYGGIVSPGEVIAAAQSLGLRPVSEPRLRGPVWVVRAVAREGTLLRVVVDSRSGRVVEMHAINDRRMGPVEPDPRYAMRGRGYDPYGPGPSYRSEPVVPYESSPPPYDDDELDDQPVPQPRGYVPEPHSSYSPPPASKQSSKPVEHRVASRPSATAPLPKARPADIKGEARSEGKKDSNPAVASSTKSPETTGSIPTPRPKKPLTSPKSEEYPVQPPF